MSAFDNTLLHKSKTLKQKYSHLSRQVRIQGWVAEVAPHPNVAPHKKKSLAPDLYLMFPWIQIEFTKLCLDSNILSSSVSLFMLLPEL